MSATAGVSANSKVQLIPLNSLLMLTAGISANSKVQLFSHASVVICISHVKWMKNSRLPAKALETLVSGIRSCCYCDSDKNTTHIHRHIPCHCGNNTCVATQLDLVSHTHVLTPSTSTQNGFSFNHTPTATKYSILTQYFNNKLS